jgi:hypothetical protein
VSLSSFWGGGGFRGKSILRGMGVVVVVYRTLRSIGNGLVATVNPFGIKFVK